MKLQIFILAFLISWISIWANNQDSLKVNSSEYSPPVEDTLTHQLTPKIEPASVDTVDTQTPIKVHSPKVGTDPIKTIFDFNIVKNITLFTLIEVLILLMIGFVISQLLDWINNLLLRYKFITFIRPVFVILKIMFWIIVFYLILSLLVKATDELLLLFFILLVIISGVAAIPMIRNLVGGFYVSLEKPFVKGDFISISNYSGKIKNMGWRSTSVLTEDNNIIFIPNSVFLTSPLENLNIGQKEKQYTFSFELPIEYDVVQMLSIIKDGALASPYTFIHKEIKVYLEKSDFIKGSNIFKLNLYLFDSKYEDELIHSINILILKSIQEVENK